MYPGFFVFFYIAVVFFVIILLYELPNSWWGIPLKIIFSSVLIGKFYQDLFKPPPFMRGTGLWFFLISILFAILYSWHPWWFKWPILLVMAFLTFVCYNTIKENTTG